MDKHEERKGADLIEDGKFAAPLGGVWKRGEKPNNNATIGNPTYQGKLIKTGRMQNDGWLEQFFELPTPRGEHAKYELTLMYQTSKRDSAYQIARNGEFATEEFPLPWDGSLQDPQPLDFVPTNIASNLKPAPSDVAIGVRFRYPKTADHDSGTLDVYDVSVRLYLGPLELRGFKIDEEHFDGSALFLCKGAEGEKAHNLSLLVAEGNVWEGTEVALEAWGTGLPPAGFECEPPLNRLQLIDRQWKLFVSPTLATDNFALQIQSKWDTEQNQLRELVCNVGDYRVKVAKVMEPVYDPIVNKQKVSVGLAVASWYTEDWIEGCRMTFDGKESFSDDLGTATFDYEPSVAGSRNIEVMIDSPYYAKKNVQHLIAVKVLASDPWEDAQISLGGNAAYSLGEKDGYPHRGIPEYRIRVTAPPGSELWNYPVKLNWNGPSAEALKVTVEPPLSEFVEWKDGAVEWVLNCSDALEGAFQIGLQANRLMDPSPQNTLSLAFNDYELGEYREANRTPVLNADETVRVKLQVLGAGTTEGVRGVLVLWQTPTGSVTTYTGWDGWAELIYKPEKVGTGKLTAQIRNRGDDEDALIEKAFEFTAVQSNPWTDEVELSFSPANLVPGGAMDFYCVRGESLTLHVKPKPGSKLLGSSIELRWRDDKDPGLGVKFEPPLNVAQLFTAEGVLWKMTAGARSGWVELDLVSHFVGLPEKWELSGRLVAEQPLDDGVFLFDSTVLTKSVTSYPCLGAIHTLEFFPNADAATSRMPAQLLNRGNQRPLGIEFAPALGSNQVISVEGVKWTMDCTSAETADTFELALVLIDSELFYSGDIHLSIGHNRLEFSGSRQPTILPVVDENEAAYVAHCVVSFYTGQPVQEAQVTYTCNGEKRLVFSRYDGWTHYACKPQSVAETAVEASLLNRYNGQTVSADTITVEALKVDAWQEETVIKTEDSPEQSKLGVKTIFPRQGATIGIRFAPMSQVHPAVNTYVRIGWSGTPISVSGTSSSPLLGTATLMTGAGVGSTFAFGSQRSASFGLFIASANLLRLSPVNAMSLGPVPEESLIAHHEQDMD